MSNEVPQGGQFRFQITGIPHCPNCGEMLWPPEYTNGLISESGEIVEDILNTEPKEKVYHEDCYEDEQLLEVP